ncbi:hypothetical protein FRB99_005140 [Tulasnella sp. 403]|nr:hypothetical protein FRB99_005140 [Tulasnella sp. 403]
MLHRAFHVRPIRGTLAVTRCRFYSTGKPARPYHFSVGVGFAGKPVQGKEAKLRSAPKFPASSDIAAWAKKQYAVKQRWVAETAGDDAFFVQEMKRESGMAVGVADGVGGWSDSGQDPGVFSQGLMYYSSKYCRDSWAGEADPVVDSEGEATSPHREVTPTECLRLAYDSVLQDRLVGAGSSTALIATLDARSGLMKAANLGDSGFMVIRNKAAIHIQAPQTHYFNCPKQLAKLPPSMRSQGIISDQPEHADSYSCTLRHGDVVLLYTDGVSDNVWPGEMVALSALVMRQGGTENEQAQGIADAILLYTQEYAAALAGERWYGGKIDDATVVSVLVSEGVHDPSVDVPII